jgi:hypothetical protein
VQPSRRDSASAPDFGLRRVQVLAFAILVLGLDVAVLGACSSGDEEPAAAAEGRGSLRAEHFFLLTADTWRADFLGREIAGTPLTPQLDAFVAARGGIVFEDNTSVAAMTSPGVAGILSGLMPLRSGVMENVHVLPTTVPTLSELLGAHGFRTAAFVANPVLRPGYGFERGFETYELLPAEPPDRKARGAAVVARALRWLDERGPAERLFLWLHFMEPHGPYEPPPDLLDALPLTDFGVSPIPVARLVVGDQVGRGGVPHYQWNSDAHPGGDDGREYVRRYAAEVMALDRVLGSFLAALETRGLLETSLTVVASDHGEALLGDHGFFFSHANYATEDQADLESRHRADGESTPRPRTGSGEPGRDRSARARRRSVRPRPVPRSAHAPARRHQTANRRARRETAAVRSLGGSGRKASPRSGFPGAASGVSG